MAKFVRPLSEVYANKLLYTLACLLTCQRFNEREEEMTLIMHSYLVYETSIENFLFHHITYLHTTLRRY